MREQGLAVIDAEYEVIEDPRPRLTASWSFWADDFPNLFGIACGLGTLIGLKLLFLAYWPS